MQAELVAVGSELLLGELADTNSTWLSARLAEVGIAVRRHTAVGDDLARIQGVLGEALVRADLVVVTGGLGPTQDDLTRHAVAGVAGTGLVRDDRLAAHIEHAFASRGRRMPASNLVQADVPEGAVVLEPVGTAAGFALELRGESVGGAGGVSGGAFGGASGGALLACLPGVPHEMRVMTQEQLLPLLVDRGGLAVTVTRAIRTAGMAESDVAELVAPVIDELGRPGDPEIAFLASRAETRVKVTATATDRAAALARVDPLVERIRGLLGAGVVGLDDEGAEHAVARQLSGAGLSLAVAESVTGGGLGARLVRVPGASTWFRGGLTVYQTSMKTLLAGVDPGLLEREGPVSEAAADALARGAAQRLEADVGVSVVGVAGPDPQGGREVGTVCVGVALPDASTTARSTVLPAAREREQVQEWAASVALDVLRRRLARFLGS